MIEKIIIISLFTIGYCCTFWEGMIFERIGDWADAHLPEWLWKPLGGCYICCCAWMGTGLYWFVFPYCKKFIVWNGEWLEWLLCVIPAMGLNAVISQFTNKEAEVKITSMPEEKLNTGKQYSMKDWCFNCTGYTETEFSPEGAKCSICGILKAIKSNDPPGHPDDWMQDEEDKT